MTDVISLLTFPETSKAFTAYRSTVVDIDDRSASHPHKTPRLDADSDSASASRSRDYLKGKNVNRAGPTKIQVHGFAGGAVGSALSNVYDSLFARLRGSIGELLTKGYDELHMTYEGVYTACRGDIQLAPAPLCLSPPSKLMELCPKLHSGWLRGGRRRSIARSRSTAFVSRVKTARLMPDFTRGGLGGEEKIHSSLPLHSVCLRRQN
ncbi:uncharacterized protein EDB91DRAFT_750937 [Suillus paluster]|uniref:uncharacterized protein n=1 Tax=Suillus paluster TaxID=48578 RepID=UPI001B87FFF0|nr:uncharacterized protein EDB91DRAFT_750937 [Suillus paluster]KAG1730715.1 hypothetical protein EDB91DRAFT_750937 [Suillus paluster]